jgi:plasmid stabilization system protein ParE
MRRRFRREALTDLREAATWYDEQKPGLGDTFLEVLEDSLDRIEGNPLLYPRVRGELRRAPLGRPFPHLIFYLPKGEILEVVAVFHPARNPRIWQRR